MPESVLNAAPTTVLPASLCSAFAHSRTYPILISEYRDGEVQRSYQASTSRRRWTQTRHLTIAELLTLRTFYFARSGPMEPFYYYDPFETSPMFSHDPTGVDETGRYTVRFDSPWEESVGMGSSQVPVSLVQLA